MKKDYKDSQKCENQVGGKIVPWEAEILGSTVTEVAVLLTIIQLITLVG